MRIVFLPVAVRDLEWFRSYYGQIFPDGAKKAAEQYRKTIGLVRETPMIGRPIAESGVREYAIPRTPFSLIYRIRDGRIEVLRFWDQRAERAEDWIGE